MKILLDECVDRRFARDLSEHEVVTVPQQGWAGVKNGSLMKLAELEFDAFITVDRNLSFQQDLPSYDIIVIVLRSLSNRYQDSVAFGPKVINSLASAKSGSAVVLELDA
ncbi:MAG: DUF5615 family PIN-like protein [Pyrinomonadaceae bacterium]|nr:DUF5615 family PIN-like protein [Pyrinomonadaceae bacterium]